MNKKNLKQIKQENNKLKKRHIEPLKLEQLNNVAGGASRAAWG